MFVQRTLAMSVGGRAMVGRVVGRRGVATLSHELLRAKRPKTPPTRTAVVMHGILGNHKNLRSFARKFVVENPAFQMLLVTHRNHGDSGRGEGPHTVSACAQDIVALVESLDLPAPPEIVVGHSFGGRVAQQLLCESNAFRAKHTWVLDTLPCNMASLMDSAKQYDPNSVIGVMKAIDSIALPMDNKNEMMVDLNKKGVDGAVSAWMTTNVKPTEADPTKLEWSFDLPNAQEMLADMIDKDYWPMLEKLPADGSEGQVHFIQAERNTTQWTPEVIDRFAQVNNPAVELIELSSSGHWVHMDNPIELFYHMKPTFQ